MENNTRGHLIACYAWTRTRILATKDSYASAAVRDSQGQKKLGRQPMEEFTVRGHGLHCSERHVREDCPNFGPPMEESTNSRPRTRVCMRTVSLSNEMLATIICDCPWCPFSGAIRKTSGCQPRPAAEYSALLQ